MKTWWLVAILISAVLGACADAPGDASTGPERDAGGGGRPRQDGGRFDDAHDATVAADAAELDGTAVEETGDPDIDGDDDAVAADVDTVGADDTSAADVSAPEDATDATDATDTSADVPTGDTGGVCVAVEGVAESTVLPVDIIWVVDNSLSMQEEVELISDNINAFASFIAASGIDYRVVMLSYDDPVVGDGWYHVCVPPPLSNTAAGVCPTGRDVDSARYLHVREIVDSRKSLTELIANYADFSGFLRPEALHHIILVTDDNDDLTSASFLSQWRALASWLDDTVVHSIVTTRRADIRDPFDDSCTTPGCPCGYAVGTALMDLSTATAGEVFSICEADWGSIFSAIAASVVEGTVLPCSYDVPPPEDDESAVDAERVNVFFTPAGGSRTLVPGVDTAGECGVEPGWYWPTAGDVSRIELCPASCGLIDGNVELEFGCRTIKL
jgi:hypothetical protein